MYKISPFLFLIVLSGFLISCTKVGLVALNATSGLDKNFTVRKNISYGNNERQKLDVYFPKKIKAELPVVVFFYGGSWQEGSKKNYKFMASALTSLGTVVVIPNYQLYPQVKFPTFVEDGAMAVDWAFKNIQNYSGDPKKVFVMGHSAGAQIGALLSFDKHYLQKYESAEKFHIQGFIGLAGPYDFLPFTNPTFKKIFAPENKYSLSQPITFITGHEPPVLLIHGKKDITVGIHNSQNLTKKIKEKKGNVTTYYYDNLNHVGLLLGFSKWLRKPYLLKDVHHFILE